MTRNCLIALGANLPTTTRTPLEVLKHALRLMKSESIDVKSVSLWYVTPAFPPGSGPDYVNAVAKIETDLTADQTLNRLADIEIELGRVRTQRWGARVCDLDLLSYERAILPDLKTQAYWQNLPLEAQLRETPEQLILPHPRMTERAFVLIPLRDVAPDWVHPVSNRTLTDLIDALPEGDKNAVKPMPQSQ
jgi:2-amino-4-hydroxy-6-hydroxymethyldihydropteridine diphosphokinase